MPLSPITLGTLGCLVGLGLAAARSAAADAEEDANQRARGLIAWHEATVKPLEIEAARRWFTANVSGQGRRLPPQGGSRNAAGLAALPARPLRRTEGHQQARPADPLWPGRSMCSICNICPSRSIPSCSRRCWPVRTRSSRRSTCTGPKVGGRELTDNEVRHILQGVDRFGRTAGRLGSQQGGRPGGRGRSEAAGRAAQQGRPQARIHGLSRHAACLGEQSQEQVLQLFDDLDALTREPFRAAKAEIDAALARQLRHRRSSELRPWHYHDPFFQEPPDVFGDRPRRDLQAARHPQAVPRVLRRHRAADRRRAAPAAISTRSRARTRTPSAPTWTAQGDVRVLANIVPNKEWMATMLHELGHAVYSSKNIPPSVPYVLRDRGPPLTTEGVAMMFERFADNADWLQAMGVAVPDPQQFDGDRRPDAAEPAADLLALVPGDVPFREGDVRRPRARPQPAVVGPGREVPGAAAARGPQRAGLRQPRSTSSAPRPITTTT